MRNLLFILLMMMTVNVFAQNSDYDVIKDKKHETTIFRGQCTFQNLLNEGSFSWLSRISSEYTPDSASLAYLKKQLPKYQLVVFMGTWDYNTYSILPKLYKVLQLTNFPMSQYLMYGVDRSLAAKYVEHKIYRITAVPTIIVFRGNIEVGRIKEKLNKSVEKDLAAIIDVDIKKQDMKAAANEQKQ